MIEEDKASTPAEPGEWTSIIAVPLHPGGLLTQLIHGRPHLEISTAGLSVPVEVEVEESRRQVTRQVRWEDIAWTVCFEPRASAHPLPTIGTPERWIDVTIGLVNGERLTSRAEMDDSAWIPWSEFAERLNSEMTQRLLPRALLQLKEGKELDFGAVRLTATEIRYRWFFLWKSAPLAPWRTAKDSDQNWTLELPWTPLRNPGLLCELVRQLVPRPRPLVGVTNLGNLRSIELPGAKPPLWAIAL